MSGEIISYQSSREPMEITDEPAELRLANKVVQVLESDEILNISNGFDANGKITAFNSANGSVHVIIDRSSRIDFNNGDAVIDEIRILYLDENKMHAGEVLFTKNKPVGNNPTAEWGVVSNWVDFTYGDTYGPNSKGEVLKGEQYIAEWLDSGGVTYWPTDVSIPPKTINEISTVLESGTYNSSLAATAARANDSAWIVEAA